MMPGKPVAARGKRFSPAELEAARRVRLADVIADDLVVLFCGANPGLSSAAARAPFATPSDRWWPALYESGFTPRRLAPHEAHELLALGLGLTSLVRRPTVGVAELAKAEFVEGGRLLRRRVLARRPRWLAVLGVTAYRAAFARPDAAVGLQQDTIGSTRLWILPNPSGLNAHYPPRALATEFARLRVAAGLPDRSRRLEDATLYRRKGACALRRVPRLCQSTLPCLIQFHRGNCRGWPARAGYPARAGGLWLWRVLVRFLFQAVVVPSGFRIRVQPRRWIMT